MPDAQYFPYFFAPNILPLNSFENIPETVDLLTPTFSNKFPPDKIKEVPPPSFLFFLLQSLLMNFFSFSKKKPVTLKRIVQSYKRSKCRLLVINYDRVLASDTWDSQFLPPVQFVDACLRSLTADKRNIVVLYSGRDKDTLTTWFGSIPRLILGAEYGAFVKLDKTREWISLVYENIEQVKWKEAVLPIVKDFNDRTPGSEIETKEHSITWFYGDADPAFGEWQAKDMLSHLEEVLGNYPVQLVKREKALEIRALSCGQKEFLEYVIQTLFDKPPKKA